MKTHWRHETETSCGNGAFGVLSLRASPTNRKKPARHQTSETIDKNRAIGSAQSTRSARVSDQRLADGDETEDFMSVLLKQAVFNPDDAAVDPRRARSTCPSPRNRNAHCVPIPLESSRNRRQAGCRSGFRPRKNRFSPSNFFLMPRQRRAVENLDEAIRTSQTGR